MTPTDDDGTSVTRRKPRADAERNRTLLMQAAKAAFAELGPDVAMEEIARRAAVGIGTLYRHFPTRDAVLEAVYRREVEQLAGAAVRLLEAKPPAEALRAWMGLFVDYVATKRIIAPALKALSGGSSELFAASGQQISAAVALLVDRAKAEGAIQADVDPVDLLYALFGFITANNRPNWESGARRLIDILIAGLKSHAPQS